ncbi:MAG: phage shock protein PspC (stress-responsive transcriptional regulator) [Gammaproteobacteria bacterium]|jgi:phage shock protein PspC (stress-responsive transcriptional regulator)
MKRHHTCHSSNENETGKRKRCKERGPISRVVRGLASRLGIHRHTVIAGFVLGFVFVPMLTLLIFLAALYWANQPGRIEEQLDRVAAKAKRTYKEHFGGERENGPTTKVDKHAAVPDFPELRRKFEELETRASAMEACVSSEEYSLNRQFRNMGR